MALYGEISEPQKTTPIQEQSKQNTLSNTGKENLEDNAQESKKNITLPIDSIRYR